MAVSVNSQCLRRVVLSVLAVLGPAASASAGPSSAAASSSTATGVLAYHWHWTALKASPLGVRYSPILVWTGGELIELGGLRKNITPASGAAYDPVTRRWRRIAQVHGNVGFANAVTAWTGRQLFVTNGQTASCRAGQPRSDCLPQAGLYDPAANRWSTTLLPRQLDGLAPMAAVWTGSHIVLAADNTNRGRLGVASYDPATGRWKVITPQLPRRHPARFPSLVATPSRLILWSLWDRIMQFKNGASDRAGVDVLVLGQTGQWRYVTGNWPHESVNSPVFTGHSILVSPGEIWCGLICIPPPTWFPGYFANPGTLHRSIIPLGPLGRAVPAFIWTGHEVVAIDLYDEISGYVRPDDLALYNPATGRWYPLPHPPGYPPLGTPPVWASHQLLVLTDHGALLAFRRQ